MESEAGSSRTEYQLPHSALQDQGGRSAPEENYREAGETKLKNHLESENGMANMRQLDATELKRRAAEDAVKDADSYAISARPQARRDSAVKGLDRVSQLMKTREEPESGDESDGIDGVMVHANDSDASLVLSDEMLQISLPDEIAALTTEPIKIFHVDGSAPWVEHVIAGKA